MKSLDIVKGKMRGQATLEYLMTYSWALMIIAILLTFLYFFLSAPTNAAPSTCSFSFSITCEELIVTSNSVTAVSRLGAVLTNSQTYPLLNPTISFNISGTLFSGPCTPNYVDPGGVMICNASTNSLYAAGSSVAGQIIINGIPCTTHSSSTCSNFRTQSFVGTFNTRSVPLQSASFANSLSVNVIITNTTQVANGQLDKIVATVLFLGYPLQGASVSFSQSNTFATLSPVAALTDINGKAFSYISSTTTGYDTISISFATNTISSTVYFSSIPVSLLTGASISAPSNSVVDAGQCNSWTSSLSGIGNSPYSYNWFIVNSVTHAVLANTLDSSNRLSDTFTYCTSSSDVSASPETANVVVTDSTPTTVNSPYSPTFIINKALSIVSLTPNPSTINSGQSSTLTGIWSGGTSTYNVIWYTGPAGNSCAQDSANIIARDNGISTTSNSIIVSPTTSKSYCFMVTDSATTQTSALSTNAVVNVNSGLSVPTLTPSNVILDTNEIEVYTATWSGGTGPYTVNFFNVTGNNVFKSYSVSTTTNSYTFTVNSPTQANVFKFNVIITDSLGSVSNSITNTITVNTLLTAGAITPSSPSIPVGGSVTLTANPSGGTKAYSYTWYSNTLGSPACNSANVISGQTASTFAASPTSNTFYTYQVADSASTPETACSAAVTVNVIALGVDGNAANSSATGNIISVTFSPAFTNDVLYCGISLSSGTVAKVQDNKGNTWTKRGSVTFDGANDLETWNTIWSGSGSITINALGTVASPKMGLSCFGIKGALTSSPFDPHAGLPGSNTVTSVISTFNIPNAISTTNSNDFIIGIASLSTGDNSPTLSAGTGFTAINSKTTNMIIASQYKIVSTAQTNLNDYIAATVTCISTCTTSYAAILTDAVT